MSHYITRDPARKEDRVLASGVLCVLLALFTLTFSGLPEGPRGEVEFQATRALATTGTWALASSQEVARLQGQTLPFPPGTRFLQASVGTGDRVLFPKCGPGQALVGVPFYWAGRCIAAVVPRLEQRHQETQDPDWAFSEYFAHWLLCWRGPLFTALTAFLLVLAARRLRVSRSHAWFAAFSYGLSTFAWSQSRTGLADVQATFLLFLSFHLLLRVRARLTRLEPPATWEFFVLGLALTLTWLTRLDTLPAVLVLCAATEVIVTRGLVGSDHRKSDPGPDLGPSRRTLMSALLLPMAVGLGVLSWIGHTRTGSWAAPRPEGLAPLASWPSALAGLLISPGHGLVWMAPLVLIVPFGLARARRRGERLLERVVLAVFCGMLLTAVSSPAWHGGWTYGPRLLLPALPFLWLAVALGLRHAQSRPMGRAGVMGLFVLGVVIQLPGVLVSTATHLDLALQAKPSLGSDSNNAGGEELANDDLEPLHWAMDFAAPWARWRIVRQRAAGLGESYDAQVLFGVQGLAPLSLSRPAQEGFRHLAWVDLRQRLGGTPWAAFVALGALAILGLYLSLKGMVEMRT